MILSYMRKWELKSRIKECEERKEKNLRYDLCGIIDLLERCDLKDPWILDVYIKYQREWVESCIEAWGDREAWEAWEDLHELYLFKGDLDNAISALKASADSCERVAKHEGKGDDEYAKAMWKEYMGRTKSRRKKAKKYKRMTETELNREKVEILRRREEERRYAYSLTSILECTLERVQRAVRG